MTLEVVGFGMKTPQDQARELMRSYFGEGIDPPGMEAAVVELLESQHKRHELKVWPQFYAALEDGSKTFELRLNDRGFQVGDELLLNEWRPDDDGTPWGYTGREMSRRITYVLHLGDTSGRTLLAPGYVVLALAPLPAE